MKMKRMAGKILLFTVLLLLAVPLGASAASYTWKSVGNGDMQCYKNGTTLVKNAWVGKKHLNANGYMDRNTWVVRKVNGVSKKVFVRDDGKWVKNFKEGWQKINGEYYYYTAAGKMISGWIKSKDGEVFYVDKTTMTRVTGFCGINGKLYYFESNGVRVTNRELTYNGVVYIADENGVCVPAGGSTEAVTPTPTVAASRDMLFFLTFESGSAAYDQTGGDNGNACGAYQFDNRYSLLPFVKYAYAKNSTLCAEFKKFAAFKKGTKLKSNKKFYKAWHKIYARNPQAFAELQDEFAKSEYYDPVETRLTASGYDIASRSDAVKGAVYSYAIQHGQTSAIAAVRACKLKSTMTDKKFLKKLYQYRIKMFPAYKSRYVLEYALAVSKL